MKTVTVTLGGQPYSIKSLPIKQSAQWRKALGVPFGAITGVLEHNSLDDVFQAEQSGDGQVKYALNLGGIVGAVTSAGNVLLGSIDTLLELLFAYSPELQADRERIEAEAYDDEALHAFLEVLKLAYPFGELASLASGAKKKPTR